MHLCVQLEHRLGAGKVNNEYLIDSFSGVVFLLHIRTGYLTESLFVRIIEAVPSIVAHFQYIDAFSIIFAREFSIFLRAVGHVHR